MAVFQKTARIRDQMSLKELRFARTKIAVRLETQEKYDGPHLSLALLRDSWKDYNNRIRRMEAQIDEEARRSASATMAKTAAYLDRTHVES